jgi:predicted PurR-regulated permease PerM
MTPTDPSASPSIQDRTFTLLLLAATIGLAWILLPFYSVVLWGAIVALLFMPVHRRLLVRLRRRRTAAALLTVLLVVLIVVIPFALITAALAREATAVVQRVQSGELDPALFFRGAFDALPAWAMGLLDRAGLADFNALQRWLAGAMSRASSFIATHALSFGQDTFEFVVGLFVMLYLAFFLIRDGDDLVRKLKRGIPLPQRYKQELLDTFTGVVRATVKGNLVVAIVQGALGGVAFWFLDVRGALLWAVLMAFFSLLPAVGAGLIWLPVALYLLMTGSMWSGIGLIAYGVLVIGLVDNVLRPVLVGKDTRMPDWLVMITTLGGMALLGINGFVLGPTVAALFIAAWHLHLTRAPECRSGRLPVSAQRLHEEHGGHEALAAQLRGLPLAGQQRLLGGDDVEVGRRTALVARGGHVEHARGGGDGRARLLVGAVQRGHAGDAVLGLLHRDEHHATVVLDRRCVSGAREIDAGLHAPVVEQHLRGGHAHRPQDARRIEQRGERAALDAEARRERHAREEGGPGDADLRVRRGHRALRGGHVGPALEHVGRHADRDGGHVDLAQVGRDGEARRRRAGKRRDRVLELRALPAQQFDLHARGVEQRLLLRHVEPGGGAALVARVDQLQRALLQGDGAAHRIELDVGGAQVEVGRGQVGGEQQPRVLEVGGRLLRGGARGFHRALHAAGEVDLVAHGHREHEVVLHRREVGRRVVGQRPVGGDALARGARADAELRQHAGRRRGERGARLHEARVRDRERGAVGERLPLQRVEALVAEALPPRAACPGVVRTALAPRRVHGPAHGHVERGLDVVGPRGTRGQDHAGGEDRRAHGHEGSLRGVPFAAAEAARGSGPTTTVWPSAIQSGGFITRRSLSAAPDTSSVVSP